jgi:hypothetical protein
MKQILDPYYDAEVALGYRPFRMDSLFLDAK